MVDVVLKRQVGEDVDYCLWPFTTVSSVFDFKSIKALMQVCKFFVLSVFWFSVGPSQE